jgi:hypothetical protein
MARSSSRGAVCGPARLASTKAALALLKEWPLERQMKEGVLVKQHIPKKDPRRLSKRIRFAKRHRRMTFKQLEARGKEFERMAFQKRFELEVFYRGLSHKKDEAIEKAARRPSEGSGMMIATELRDMRFEFKSEASALAAAGRIKATVRGARCMLRSSKRV